ncbi:putative 1,3-beta-glucan protein [Xylariaceae sp. FL1272]|nr:putative 1,3-beta-glucan protein [Xylariaceae sp. FL1272]
MANIGSAFRSFWHTMTSYDRHSNFDAPHRTGRHVPLSRQNTLTSVATASDSRADVTAPFSDDVGRLQTQSEHTAYMGAGMPAASPLSPGPNAPYSPGMRSLSARRQDSRDDGFETVSSPGDIPMQSFANGAPPAPPVHHSWKRIDRWAEDNYPELWDQMCEGCTNNDLNELEHQLDCSLPQDVRDSLMIHDGQERGGLPTGVVFSHMLLDCEEIVQEWDQWRRVNQQYLLEMSVAKPAAPSKAFGGSDEASSSRSVPGSPSGSQKSSWRQDLQSRQDSVPAGAVQRAYAHPAWIPLVRDWGGNNLAVDLAPGPSGTWGQIILFGRDYDTKYVVARSWSAFMAILADDLGSSKWYVDEETNELKLREFKTTRVEPSYFDILRWRMDQKHGRTAKTTAKRRSGMPAGAVSPGGSPYASPADANGDARGRSLQRLNSPSPLVSPARPGFGKPSPLARVAEESDFPKPKLMTNGVQPTKLVEVETPKLGAGAKSPIQADALPNVIDKEAPPLKADAGLINDPADELEGGMKTIEI